MHQNEFNINLTINEFLFWSLGGPVSTFVVQVNKWRLFTSGDWFRRVFGETP